MPVSSLYKSTVRFLIWIAPWTCPPVFGDPPAEAEQSPFGEQQSSSDYPPLTFPGGVGDQWVYGNATAKALVEQARRYDPMDAKHDDHDREQAVELYEAAIESQPGATERGTRQSNRANVRVLCGSCDQRRTDSHVGAQVVEKVR